MENETEKERARGPAGEERGSEREHGERYFAKVSATYFNTSCGNGIPKAESAKLRDKQIRCR